MVTTCARRLAAWVHSEKAARVGGHYQAGHDMEAGTSWPEIAYGLSRPYQCIRVGQVGGDGSSCSGSAGTELPSWAADRLATTAIPGKDGDVTLKKLGKVD